MQATNLYMLTRGMDESLMALYEKALSQREEELRIRKEELDVIKMILSNLTECKAGISCFEDWVYSYSIPHIGKEFDLLKIGENCIVNLELKSQVVSKERIIKQLAQNRYYLKHISSNIYSFTAVKYDEETIRLFELKKDGLTECTFDRLKRVITGVVNPVKTDINGLFKSSDYLISPINTPEKFLRRQYYLNNQQEVIKREITRSVGKKEQKIYGIKGGAGTGKTLLLYDIARTIAENYKVKVCMIHCGMLTKGHNTLNSLMKNVKIIDARSIKNELLSKYDVICIDESQRLYKGGVDKVLELFETNTIQSCIFSYDFAQALSKSEVRRNIPEHLRGQSGFEELKLTRKIRPNKEIYAYMRTMLKLTDRAEKGMEYRNIDIIYANNAGEANQINKIYRKRGYKFITITPPDYDSSTIEHCGTYINSHQVIGQEFDNVVLILDDNFRYNESGKLEAKKHPNPDYLLPRLFYQNISRAREKLCIIVLGNLELFRILLLIKENRLVEYRKEK